MLPPEGRLKISQYILELRWVIHHAEALADSLFHSEEERKRFLCCSGSNPYLRSGARDHGLCCLLWEQYSRQDPNIGDKLPSLQKPYDVLRREALLTHITALGYWTQREDWLSPEGPGTIVRGSMYQGELWQSGISQWTGTRKVRRIAMCCGVFRRLRPEPNCTPS